MNDFQLRAKSPVDQGVVMTKLVSVLGLLVALSLGAIAFFGVPGGWDVQAGEDLSPRVSQETCTAADAALDEGYGVTRGTIRACAQR
jgi:hypothetical protein